MDRSTALYLIKKTYTEDTIGQRIASETKRMVYANVRSVSRAEWQAAGEMGLKPEFMATIFAPDYHGEDLCELEIFGTAAKYSIYRIYLGANETLELYLEKKVGK